MRGRIIQVSPKCLGNGKRLSKNCLNESIKDLIILTSKEQASMCKVLITYLLSPMGHVL